MMQVQFDNRELLKEFLVKEMNFRLYNLEEGLDQFEANVLATDGSTNYEDLQTHTFDWLTDDGKEIEVELAFVCDDDGEDDYVIVK